MGKGKKFTAAEKHFLEKEKGYQNQIRILRERCLILQEGCESITIERDKLQDECRAKDDWIRRLLEYTELSGEDIKRACEKDKSTGAIMDAVFKMFNAAVGIGGNYADGD